MPDGARWLTAISLLLLAIASWMPGSLRAETDEGQAHELTMYVFMSETCPVCQAQKPFLEALDRQHAQLEVLHYEVMATREHHDLLRAIATAHQVRPGSVPMIFAGGEHWVGDSRQIRTEIARHVEHCLESGCPDARALAEDLLTEADVIREEHVDAVIDLPLLGQVDLARQPLLMSTALIAFVDGFNPCSIWVLTILLALVLHSGSRGRVMLVGLTFLITTAVIYGLFIAGVFSVLAFAAYLPWIYWIVALFALVFGLVNIKDYFWFQRGISFTIDDKQKPGIFKGFRELMTTGHSPLALMGATILMAAGIALIELPCTAGFPVIWSGLVSAHGVGLAEFLFLLGIYLVIYLGIELVIFIIAVVKLRIDRFQEQHGRILKLIGGVIMLALAIVLITAPELMSSAGSAMLVFVVAFAATALIFIAHRYLLPRLGIKIGDDW